MTTNQLKRKLEEVYETVPVEEVVSLPGKTIEDVVTTDKKDSSKTPFRGYEDLKKQYFGRTIFNKQRLQETGDSLLYQAAYAAPGALAGYLVGSGDMNTTLFGLGIGKLLGHGYLLAKEKKRLQKAMRTFSSNEKRLLEKLTESSNKWALGTALVGGLGTGLLSLANQNNKLENIGKPIISGVAAAMAGAMLGNSLGHSIARNDAKKNKTFKNILNRYEKFD